MILQGVGLSWLALPATQRVDYLSLVRPLLMAGVGVSMVLPTSPTAALSSVIPQDMGKAAGVNNTLQRLRLQPHSLFSAQPRRWQPARAPRGSRQVRAKIVEEKQEALVAAAIGRGKGDFMMSRESSIPRAVADLAEGLVLASVEVEAPPERVFDALASKEVTTWWVRPGVFDTREWTGDVRMGGAWRVSGMARGRPYALEGEFTEVDRPRKLVHTWRTVGAPGVPTTVAYLLEKVENGTRLTLRHSGFASRETCINTCVGWETSFEQLARILAGVRGS
jgi:uncharacterized protein YndB with AHSA1/START domain